MATCARARDIPPRWGFADPKLLHSKPSCEATGGSTGCPRRAKSRAVFQGGLGKRRTALSPERSLSQPKATVFVNRSEAGVMRALGIMLRKLELLGATSQSPIADHPDVAIGREVLTPDDEYQRLPERDVSAGVSRLLLPRGTGVRPVAKRSQDGATAPPRRNADARSRRLSGVPITLFGLAVDTEYRQGDGVDLRQYTIHSVTELAELALRNWRDSAKEVMRYVVVNRQTGRLVVPPIGFTIGLPDRAPLVPSRRMKPVTAQKSEEQFFEQLRDFLRMTTKIHVSGRDIPGFGGLGGTRTPDALLRTEALYPLSYEAAAISQRERAERYPNFRCRVLCPTPSPLSSRPQSSGRSRKSSSGNRARSPNRSTG